jgi:AcrR family transcriptional regulator
MPMARSRASEAKRDRPPPSQERSRRTLERLLDAAEALLQKQPLEAIAVGDLVRAAGSSIGSFYARFPSKESLLEHLYERYDRDLHRRFDEWLARRPWEASSLAERVAWIVRQFVSSFETRRHLLRALALHARCRPETIDAATRRRREALHARLAGILLERRAEIGHPDPERAVEFVVFMIGSTCREKLLFGRAPHAEATRLTAAELEAEVTRAALAYLKG